MSQRRTGLERAIGRLQVRNIWPRCWCCPVLDVCVAERITGDGIVELKSRGNCVSDAWRRQYG